MRVAEEAAKLSYCERKKVGAVLVKKRNIIAFAYNGTVSGADNVCETSENTTKRDVVHAEMNVIAKIASCNNKSKGSKMYVTLSPCIDCSKLIVQSGIKKVFYKELYRDTSGISFLEESGVRCYQI